MSLITEYEQIASSLFTPVAKRLNAASSTDEIVAILRSHARALVGSDGIAVILREGPCCHYAAEDAIELLWFGQRFPITECISGWAMQHNETVIIPDIETDPRVPRLAYARTSMRSLAMVPLGTPQPIAALGAYWCAYVEPDQGTIRRLEILARVASLAFDRVAAGRDIAASVG